MEEAAYSLSLKNSVDYDSGILTIRGDTWEDFVLRLQKAQDESGGRGRAEELVASFFQLPSKQAQEFVRKWNDTAVEVQAEKDEARRGPSSKLAEALKKKGEK